MYWKSCEALELMILKWGQKNRKETWLKDKTFMASLKVSFLLFPFLDICPRYNFLLYCGFLLPDLPVFVPIWLFFKYLLAFPIDIIFLNYECLLTLICHLKLIFEMYAVIFSGTHPSKCVVFNFPQHNTFCLKKIIQFGSPIFDVPSQKFEFECSSHACHNIIIWQRRRYDHFQIPLLRLLNHLF